MSGFEIQSRQTLYVFCTMYQVVECIFVVVDGEERLAVVVVAGGRPHP